MKVLIIGGGNMGTTFAQGFLAAHIIRPKDLIVLEKSPERAAELRQLNMGTIHEDAGDYINEVDLIVLAVKPQSTSKLYPLIKPYLSPDKLILSIMAGVRMDTIEQQLGVTKIVRSMPNLPAKVGMGMTAFTAKTEVNRNELIQVQNLLSTTGRAIYFETEEMIDAATAISGSG
ncbi:MAG: pyrroline-5-carboxylate reductase family protein, partial [Chitinophagales bacterium]